MDTYHVRKGTNKTCPNCGKEFYDPPSGHRLCCPGPCGAEYRQKQVAARTAGGMFACVSCKVTKPLSDYHKNPRNLHGIVTTCKKCCRFRSILRAYGITQKQFEQMRRRQKSRCAICQKKRLHLYVDHNHKNGKVRALLCHHCNTGLGHFRDDPHLLQLAINFLEEHNVNQAEGHTSIHQRN